MMERANHINIAMIEDIGTNGTVGSKVAPVAEQSPKRGSTVSFHNVRYRVQLQSGFVCRRKTSHREILLDLNGIMRPGLNAILGPTGSGKSSFLDILAARKDPSGLSGEVLIDRAPQPPNFKCLSGYVVQEDVVMGTLTVRENLRFSAALRLPRSVLQSEKEARVGTQMTRGISGGERKRTNIGMELIIDPAVLFLDEPTTGLDASTANSVLLLLKRMASKGRTIILSIHQPRYSIYRLFDSLTLLVGGKMPHNNPADFFLDVINGDSTATSMTKVPGSEDVEFEEQSGSRQSIEERLVDEFRSSSYCSATRAELELIEQEKKCSSCSKSRTITYNSSFLHQLRWVLRRTFQNLMLNPQTSVAQCFSTVSAAELFITERKLFVHEYISGYYRVSVYFLSKILSDITLRTVTSVIFSCIVYFMIVPRLHADGDLVAYTATAMTMAISATRARRRPRQHLHDHHLRLHDALKINEFVGLKFCDEAGIRNMSAAETNCSYLDYLGIEYTTWGLWENHVALTVMTFIFFIIAYLKLRYIKKFT
ncbi:hypothetical protein F7725_005881 [Dissostichus mawsoni]|uniref:Broad substrate specificity ATP-binding cassette transporter ABCG2 n=1 Tax=Dissostichus mawsoni TaxID=36200 RepID=A0A7J5YSR0_DISMA|nr:hypothetical protein F7725_005881 [Dissostichus mawsoni]